MTLTLTWRRPPRKEGSFRKMLYKIWSGCERGFAPDPYSKFEYYAMNFTFLFGPDEVFAYENAVTGITKTIVDWLAQVFEDPKKEFKIAIFLVEGYEDFNFHLPHPNFDIIDMALLKPYIDLQLKETYLARRRFDLLNRFGRNFYASCRLLVPSVASLSFEGYIRYHLRYGGLRVSIRFLPGVDNEKFREDIVKAKWPVTPPSIAYFKKKRREIEERMEKIKKKEPYTEPEYVVLEESEVWINKIL